MKKSKKSNPEYKYIKCDKCEKVRKITRSYWRRKLKNGKKKVYCKSCGMLERALVHYLERYEDQDYADEKVVKRIFNGLRQRARTKHFSLKLSKQNVKDIMYKNCYYCGAEPSNTFVLFTENKEFKKEIKYQGIDRIDSDKGYIVGNIVPCCFQCNCIKWDSSMEDFIKKIETLYIRLVKKQ